MSFSDIFKASFLQEYAASVTTPTIVFFLLVSAVIGLYIFLVYRIITKRSFYNKSFNISLWVMTVITTGIIITITSNVVLSLGMVGALSIVRYRTAIKDPMDLVFLFWALAEGIMCGAGMAMVGIVLAVMVTAGVFLLNRLPLARMKKILTLSASDRACEDEVNEILKSHCQSYNVKSKSLSADRLELVAEYDSERERELLDALMAVSGVTAVSALSHDGEVTF